jgi:glycosyltransferase involved in cell wall biosynthesis
MKFLFITRTDWNEPPRARHQLAKALAKEHHVTFVAINKKGKARLEIQSPQDNITLITPYWLGQGKFIHRLPIINEIYQYWLYKKLASEYAGYHVINFDPSASLIHSFFTDVVYFCNDNFLEKKRSKLLITKLYFKHTQRIIAEKARFCTAVSEFLKDQLLVYNSSSHLVLTAAEQLDVSTQLRSPKNDIIKAVYVGWLSKLNIDWVLAACENKNVHIQLVGPYKSNEIERLTKIDNIEILGQKFGSELGAYLKQADVCIAPYKKGDDTEKVYTMPNKFWLYLNFGKPIVSCAINRLYPLPDNFVYQANNQSEFVKALLQADAENTQKLISERQQFIKLNNWESRVNRLLELYSRTKKLN